MSKRNKIILSVVGVIIGLVIILVILGLLNYKNGKALYAESLEGKTAFEDAQTAILAQDFEAATLALEQAEEDFYQAQEYSNKIVGLKYVPVIGRQLKAVDGILTAGYNISLALQKVSSLGEEVFAIVQNDGDITYRNIGPEEKEAIFEKLYQAPPELQGAKSEIDLAVLAMEQIPSRGLLKQLDQAVQPIQEYLPLIKEVIDQAVPAVETIPTIVGYPQEQTYLFLLQNNTELRPTGGFIGTYGILKVKNGEIVEFKTDNIYNLDTPAKDYLFINPPEPLAVYLSSTQWLMRDSNWSPDFPTAAQKAEEFYHLENGPEENIDGVIAVTPTFIASLLDITGAITVEGIEFTSENLVDVLQYEVEKAYYEKGISDDDRKEIIGVLADQIMDQILELPKDEWATLWQTFTKDVDEKQILIYLKDEDIQDLVEEQNWAGELKSPTDSDFLMVVDANMASLKTDPGVKRTINYSVAEEGGDLVATLDINYKNEGTFNWKSTRYRTYTRAYVPQGLELLEWSGTTQNDKLLGDDPKAPDVYDELGKTVIGGFISTEPQMENSLHYKYKLPDWLKDQEVYKLYVQKQAGTEGHSLNFTYDTGQGIKSYTPLDIGSKDGNNKVLYQTNLRIDREFEINLK